MSNAEEARRVSPEATVERRESQTIYEGLSTEESARLDGQVFPGVIDQPDGGLPHLPKGESVTGYPTDNAAQVDLPEGKRGVIDSLNPIAVEASSGVRVPVDLGLVEAGGAFESLMPVVGVRIPRQVQGGVDIGGIGVSLTPVDASGEPAGGSEGRMDGSAVFYGGLTVGSDVDMAVKPTTLGFSTTTFLRSQRSPEKLFFRVQMPQGASLVQAQDGSGAVQVVEQGKAIASVLPPSAQDAVGESVPVAMDVSGDILTLMVDYRSKEYEYPIQVDPTVVDWKKGPGNWAFTTDNKTERGGLCWEHWEGTEKNDIGYLGIVVCPGGGGKVERGQYWDLFYTTKGESKIDSLWAETLQSEGAAKSSLSYMAIAHTGYEAGPVELPHTRGPHEVSVASPSNGNTALYEVVDTSTVTQEFGEGFESLMYEPKVTITQAKGPSVSLDTTEEVVNGEQNALYGNRWASATSGKWGLKAIATDPGLGISNEIWSSPNAAKWGFSGQPAGCKGVQCEESMTPLYSVKGTGTEQLPEGEDTVEIKVEDPVGLTATTSAKVKVDNTPPTITRFEGLPSNHEIIDGQPVTLEASAKSGLAGMASIVLDVDGQQLGGGQGSCSGSCTGNAVWALSGANYAAGEHTLTVVATDTAGNVTKAEYHMVIHHAAGIAVGPGSVNPVTGELSLSTTDVSIGVPEGALAVSRSYRSRHWAQGTEGPLGLQWNLSLGSQQSLTRVSGGMILTGGSGEQIVFEGKVGGEFTSPTGDADLTLLEKTVEGKTVFTLSNNGSVTTFELPGGGSSVWMPSSTEGPNGTSTTLYKFKLENGVIEPTEELAPVPAGVSCGKAISELKEGCRALKFEYATETKAKGEKASQWNSFKGHLSEVKYIAWNASKTKTETTVAEYAYDQQGRLRAEWNPQITPSPLKTTYGYDSEGHVTAVSTAGHEPVLLEQGTVPSDAGSGRLLAVAVPSAGTALGNGEAPGVKEVPTLSSTKPVVGTKINVNLTSENTPGAWTASPLAFIYQWDDCNISGKECSPIPGAVNQAYYPVSRDEGHTLVAKATALNATGAVTAETLATSTVASGSPNTPLPEPPKVGSNAVTTLEYQVPVSGSGAPYEMSSTELAKWGQADDPSEAMAIFPPEKVMGWPAKEYKDETVDYLDGKDRAVNTALPTGGISVTEYNLYNDIIRTITPNNRLSAITEGCKAKEECKSATENTYEETGSEPGTRLLSTLGPQHTVKLAQGKEKADEEVLAREHAKYYYNEGAPSEGGPYNLVTKMTDGAQTASKEEFDIRETTTSYSGQENLGWKLRKPTAVTINPGGLSLAHAIEYEPSTGNVIKTKMPAAEAVTYASQFGTSGKENGQLNRPTGIAIDSKGDIWVVETGNDRVQEFSSEGKYLSKFGAKGKEGGQFELPKGIAVDAKGDVWVTDTGNNRVQEFNSEGKHLISFGTKGKENGQFEEPVGIAIDSKGNVWVTDKFNYRVQEFSSEGKYLSKFGTKGKENGQFEGPSGITIDSKGNVWVTDKYNDRVQEFSSEGKYLSKFGTKGKENGQFEGPSRIAIDSNGNLWVTDEENNRVQEFNSEGKFLSKFGAEGKENGQFYEPVGIAIDSKNDIWVSADGEPKVQEFIPGTPHETKTIYYSKSTNSEYPGCGGHAEWAGLPCETKPVVQPDTSGLPELPVTTYTYNIWDEPETTTETVGATTRTKTETYDSAGRPKTSAVKCVETGEKACPASDGKALPTVTDEYNTSTGTLEKQSTTTEGKTSSITSLYNKLGQLERYTDANENTTTYEYETEKEDRLKKINDNEGTESFEYNATTGLLDELTYTNGTTKMIFNATYDAEGNMLTESYPNGMTATYTYNQVNKPTALVYKKTTNCTEEEKEKCKWFKDTVIPSIHGQWLEQTSSLSHQAYTYDNAGRLTQVQNTPTEKGCTTRIYAYDEDTNRTSLTTREPAAEGKCATGGGTIEKHTYDTSDRLTDTGIKYNEFGDITALSPKDAGGKEPSEELTNSYYVNNQIASQKQKQQTIGYNLDPTRRTQETISTGEPNNSTIISHYAGPSNAPAWTTNPISGEWRRNITGINGSLVAIQNNGETPELQLTNLHDDIVAKAYLSETATELAAKADTSEFGVPTVTAPAKYSWLGAIELPTELPSGITSMGARSYVPEIGRFLQPDPIPGGSANAYSYTFGDPVNTSDPSGAATIQELVAGHAAGVVGGIEAKEEAEMAVLLAAQEAAARRAAEGAALEAQWAAEWAAGPQYAEEEEWEEWEEWGEEEGGYEEAAYHPGSKPAGEEAHLEEGLLVQPLEAGAGAAEGKSGGGGVVRLCSAEPKGTNVPCAQYASIFGDAWHWVTHHIHKLVAAGVGAVLTVVAGGATALATTGCAASAAVTADPFEAFDCYKIGIFGTTLTVAVAASTFKAWNDTKN